MARERVERLWMGGGAAAALLLAGGLWAFAVNPEMSHAASLHTQVDDTRTSNNGLQAHVGALQSAYARIGKQRNNLAAERAALPTNSALSAFIRQISAQAQQNQVTVATLTAGTPAPAGPAAAAAPASATDSSSSSSTSTAPAAAPSTTSAAGGLFTIPITVVANGTPSADLAFVRAIQQSGPRAALLTNVQLAGQTTGSGRATSTLTLQMQVFVAPQAPTAPAGSPTPSPTASPSGSPTA